MTLTEVVVSAVILGISTQVSFQGWARTSQAAATSARIDQMVELLEQRLLASRRALARAPVADVDCRWDSEAVQGVLEGLPGGIDLEMSWRFDPSADGLWLDVEPKSADAAKAFRRTQLITPAGVGHCSKEVTNER